MVSECSPPSFGRNGVDATRPEFAGAITSQQPPRPAVESSEKPQRKATIGEGRKLVLHVLDGVDRTRGVCGQPVEQLVPHLQLEHWGTSGARWCNRCAEMMGWK